MKTTHKLFSVLSLLSLLLVATATPALAFDGRSGQDIIIKANETVNDDLYVAASTFELDGTVNGDVVVFAKTITINGTITGDLIAAGQAVIINGKVGDDARIAGAALQLGEHASVGGDVVAGGASFEAKYGSTIGNDAVLGAGQALLAGSVARNVIAGTPALELDGSFGGNVSAYVEVSDRTKTQPPMNMYMSDVPVSIPSLKPGLTISNEAQIKGNLHYTSTVDLPIPAGVVGGNVTRTPPQPSSLRIPSAPTRAQLALNWALDLLRSMVTLILFGLVLVWLAPRFLTSTVEKLRAQPLPSLGWGVVAFAAFFFVLLLIFVVMIFGAILFGVLTLRGISGAFIWLGLLSIFELIVAFVLVTAFLTKILVALLSGKWIAARFNPALAEHRVWPLVIGVIVVAIVLAIPVLGWLLAVIVIFCGLGALWLWTREMWQARKTA